MKLYIPDEVKIILDTLSSFGYEAYIVGGCVRDQILNKKVDDYDITTNAKPDAIKKIFKTTVDTGIKHGTVTVLFKHEDGYNQYEITTYRVDGEYEDFRHPKEIKFVDKLEYDLSRRDFTVNAMAYNDKSGLIDKFDGIKDIHNQLIRAVGNPLDRFNEDALRMLRAVRFACKLNFKIEDKTYDAIIKLANNLSKVSRERIQAELNKILTSDYPEYIKLLFDTNLSSSISNDFNLIKCDKMYHTKDIRLAYAALVYELDDKYYSFLRNLKLDNETIKFCEFVNKYKSVLINLFLNFDNVIIKEIISEVGYNDIYNVIKIIAFKIGKDTDEIYSYIDKIRNNNEPIFIKDLKIDGLDLLNIGFQNIQVGNCLKFLLHSVYIDKALNNHDDLIKLAKERYYELYG